MKLLARESCWILAGVSLVASLGTGVASSGMLSSGEPLTAISQCGTDMPVDGKCPSARSPQAKMEPRSPRAFTVPVNGPPRMTEHAPHRSAYAKSPLIGVPIPCSEGPPPSSVNRLAGPPCDVSVDPNSPDYKPVRVLTEAEWVMRRMRPSLVVSTSWHDSTWIDGTSEADSRGTRALPAGRE